MATQAAEKIKRGDGPLSILYLDATNKEHKRVISGTKQVKVVNNASKKAKDYNIMALSQDVRDQLAAEAVKKRFDIYVRNTVKDDASADVHAATDELYASLKDGVLYSRKEGGAGGPGKSFDFDRYITIFENMVKAMVKAKRVKKDGSPVTLMTEKQVADERAKVEGLTPIDRRKRVNHLRANSTFWVLAEKQYDLEVAKQDIADGEFGDNDLF